MLAITIYPLFSLQSVTSSPLKPNTEHSVAAAPINSSTPLTLPVSMAYPLSLLLLSLRPLPCPILVGANHTSARFCSR